KDLADHLVGIRAGGRNEADEVDSPRHCSLRVIGHEDQVMHRVKTQLVGARLTTGGDDVSRSAAAGDGKDLHSAERGGSTNNRIVCGDIDYPKFSVTVVKDHQNAIGTHAVIRPGVGEAGGARGRAGESIGRRRYQLEHRWEWDHRNDVNRLIGAIGEEVEPQKMVHPADVE